MGIVASLTKVMAGKYLYCDKMDSISFDSCVLDGELGSICRQLSAVRAEIGIGTEQLTERKRFKEETGKKSLNQYVKQKRSKKKAEGKGSCDEA